MFAFPSASFLYRPFGSEFPTFAPHADGFYLFFVRFSPWALWYCEDTLFIFVEAVYSFILVLHFSARSSSIIPSILIAGLRCCHFLESITNFLFLITLSFANFFISLSSELSYLAPNLILILSKVNQAKATQSLPFLKSCFER